MKTMKLPGLKRKLEEVGGAKLQKKGYKKLLQTQILDLNRNYSGTNE